MNKDNELKRPNHKTRNDNNDPIHASPVSPDTSAPLGYIKDKPLRDKLDEEKVAEKSMGDTPGNEVESSLNPDEENPSEEDVIDEEELTDNP